MGIQLGKTKDIFVFLDLKPMSHDLGAEFYIILSLSSVETT